MMIAFKLLKIDDVQILLQTDSQSESNLAYQFKTCVPSVALSCLISVDSWWI